MSYDASNEGESVNKIVRMLRVEKRKGREDKKRHVIVEQPFRIQSLLLSILLNYFKIGSMSSLLN